MDNSTLRTTTDNVTNGPTGEGDDPNFLSSSIIAFCFAVGIFILFSNGCTLFFLHKLKDKLKRSFSMIVGLSFSDIILGVGTILFALYRIHELFYKPNAHACALVFTFLEFGTTSSLFHTFFICFERFFAVLSRNTVKRRLAIKGRVKLVIISTILIGIYYSCWKMVTPVDIDICSLPVLYGDYFELFVKVLMLGILLPLMLGTVVLYLITLWILKVKTRSMNRKMKDINTKLTKPHTLIETSGFQSVASSNAVEKARSKSSTDCSDPIRELDGAPGHDHVGVDNVVNQDIDTVTHISTNSLPKQNVEGDHGIDNKSDQNVEEFRNTDSIPEQFADGVNDIRIGSGTNQDPDNLSKTRLEIDSEFKRESKSVQKVPDQNCPNGDFLGYNEKYSKTVTGNEISFTETISPFTGAEADKVARRPKNPLQISCTIDIGSHLETATAVSKCVSVIYNTTDFVNRNAYLSDTSNMDTNSEGMSLKRNKTASKEVLHKYTEATITTFSKRLGMGTSEISNKNVHVGIDTKITKPSGIVVDKRKFSTCTRVNHKMKAMKTIGLLVLALVLFTGPGVVMFVVNAFCTNCITVKIRSIISYLWFLNSALNPCIYYFTIDEFRHSVKGIFAFCNR